MLMKMRSKMQNQKGFTLVELMVVVVILGVLVAIAVPVYNSAATNAKEKACASNIRIIEGAIEMAKANGVADADITTASLGSGNYIKEWPDCPLTAAVGTVDYVVTNGELAAHTH